MLGQCPEQTFVRGNSAETEAGSSETAHKADRSPATLQTGAIFYECPWSDSPHLWDDDDWEAVRE